MLPYAQPGLKIKMVFSGVNATQTNCNMASAVARFCPSSIRLAEFSILMIIVPDIFQDQDCVNLLFSQIDIQFFPGLASLYGGIGGFLREAVSDWGQESSGRAVTPGLILEIGTILISGWD